MTKMTTVKAETGARMFYVEVKVADFDTYLSEVEADIARDWRDRGELLGTTLAALKSLTTATEQQARALARVLLWSAAQGEGGSEVRQAVDAGGHTVHWTFKKRAASFQVYPTTEPPDAGLAPIQ